MTQNGDHPLSRALENVGFIIGLAVALMFFVGETARRLGFCGPDGCTEGLDLLYAVIQLAFCAVCVAPKMLGKQTAGKVWSGLVDKIPTIASKAKTLTGPTAQTKDE